MIITAKLRDEAFQDYLERLEHSFVYMTRTMIEVAEMLKDEVQMVTPLDTGKLSRSFRWHILTDNSRMKVFHLEMTALNPETGYDYAYTQHLGYRHDKRGQPVYYNHGITNIGFYNYRTDYKGRFQKKSNYDHWNLHQGEDKYLYWTIIRNERSAFEMIETDYLSLFHTGGVIL